MRTILGIQQTLIGMLIGNFKLVGKMANNTAVDTADQIIKFLQEEDNLCVPPNDELATATAQRDKLLEALKDLVYGKQSGLFSIYVETRIEEIDYDNVHRASVVATAKIWKTAREAIKEVEAL